MLRAWFAPRGLTLADTEMVSGLSAISSDARLPACLCSLLLLLPFRRGELDAEFPPTDARSEVPLLLLSFGICLAAGTGVVAKEGVGVGAGVTEQLEFGDGDSI